MAHAQQAESATPLLTATDHLDELHARLGFILNTLAIPSDWIDDEAACGLYFTLLTIWQEIDAISRTIYAEARR